MKKIVISLFLFGMFSLQVFAQKPNFNTSFSKPNLVGVWQRGDSVVGSGLKQNFQFSNDGTFVFNIGNDADDVRDVIQLKGKYRLDSDKIFFTITSKKVVAGSITIPDPGMSLNIFSYDGKVKEVYENEPKEMPDPCYLQVISKRGIMINKEKYYKVKEH